MIGSAQFDAPLITDSPSHTVDLPGLVG
jgi:hypothetical protein